MLFNSYAFVFLFFPVCLLGFYMFEKKRKAGLSKAFLIFMSLCFYSWFNPSCLPILLISMGVNYGLYQWMMKDKRKGTALAAGIGFNLSLLFVFKYFNFFMENMSVLLGKELPLTRLFLPLGISFFTFEQIAFLMEAYRGNLGKVSLVDYGYFVTFFPKLIQGPIVLPQEILEQPEKQKGSGEQSAGVKFNWEGFYKGLALFVMGLAKKVLLADTLGGAVDYGYQNLAALNSGDILIVILSYTLQLYFDFSGYCDMAMGVAAMLSKKLPLNFNSPYKACNIIEFWKGWHITLTRFFTKYLYIPLGGNRKGEMRTCLNTLLIFFVSGIWHGAGWQFIIWGLLHGTLYVFTRLWLSRRKRERKGFQRAFGTAFTFLYVNAAWVFFRAPSAEAALQVFKKLFSFEFGRINWELAGYFNLDEFWYVIKVLGIDGWQYSHYILMALILLAALILIFFGKTAVDVSENLKPSPAGGFILAALFVWCVLAFSQVSSFIYFNF